MAWWSAVVAVAVLIGACSSTTTPPPDDEIKEGVCEVAEGNSAPDFLKHIGCKKDFLALASQPLDATLPGARSLKVVLDRSDGNILYFQNSQKYQIHYQFASAHLSGMGRPIVSTLSEFNRTEYYSPDRRFLLGAVTYYEGPNIWAFEIAPYDTASVAMITALYDAIRAAAYFGPGLRFHPTSQAIEATAKGLPSTVRVTTTNDLFAAIDYQPLNLGEAIGQLRFAKAADLATVYLGFREIVVLDHVPNDISVVAGLITEDFQTPLSHVNVLAQNRKTPNMGLRGATTNAKLRALEGKWVKLKVDAFEWTAVEATQAEADAFWEAHKPAPVQLPPLDLTVTDLRNVQDVVVEGTVPLREAIQTAIKSFGAKAAGYSVLSNTDGVPIKKAFVIPAYHYVKFMEENGFFTRVDGLLADPEFVGNPSVRDAKLTLLREDIKKAPINTELQALLKAKLDSDFPGQTMRFRTSTNAEDLDGFPCAGCYDSHTGDPMNWEGDLLYAVKQTWATVWKFRTFEERSYHSMNHNGVGMALLVHHNFPAEEANGVAITANPFDPSGLEPGFYINVQWGGDAEVVAPPPGVYSDEFIYEFSFPGQPIIFLSHSNLVPEGTTVLTPAQTYELGKALDIVHRRFAPAYKPADPNAWYAMDCEFKFDDEASPGATPTLYMKQARPYPGRGK